jgi:hypothetical protein
MHGSGKKSKLYNCFIVAIAAALAQGSQQLYARMHERSAQAIPRIIASPPPRLDARHWIVVPEPDPAFLGHLLEDRAMARIRLVPLGR